MSAERNLVEVATAALTRKGQPKADLQFEILRELSQADLVRLVDEPPRQTKVAVLKTLRHTHHLAARLLAEGRPHIEVAAVTGYAPGRISVLLRDPAFADLVAYYQEQAHAAFTNIHERLASFGFSCLEEAQERLERNPEDFSLNQLREWMETVLDRSIAPKKGGGPGQGQGAAPVSVTVEFHQPSPQSGPIIEVKAKEVLDG